MLSCESTIVCGAFSAPVTPPLDMEGLDVAAQLALFNPSPDLKVDPVAGAIDAYLDATGAAESTRDSYSTTKRRWLEWMKTHRSRRPMLLEQVTADDLRDWLTWCLDAARSAGDSNVENTHNKRRREIRAVLQWAWNEGQIDALPRFPQKLQARTVAGHYFLTDEEMERLYWATLAMPTPARWKDPRPIGLLWRTALVLLRNYGMDTQALFPYSKSAKSVARWKHIAGPGLPPGRVANVQGPHGWLTLRRQKTGRLLMLPLEPVVKAHLDAIRPAVVDPDEPIMGRAGGMRPCQRFQQLAAAAGLQDKVDIETEAVTPWALKDLRKTCATAHNANRPGSAQYVLGHSSGVITEKHYANALPVVLEAIRTLPQPPAFRLGHVRIFIAKARLNPSAAGVVPS